MRAGRSSAIGAIEPQIAGARVRLGDTADALAAELAPARLAERGLDMVNRIFLRPPRLRLGRVRADPAALALLGLGAAWLAAENAGLLDRLGRERAETGAPPAPAAGQARCGAGETKGGDGASRPWLLALAAAAAGAALAMLVPASRREREIAAQAREQLWDTAEQVGHRTAEAIRGIGDAPPVRGPEAGVSSDRQGEGR